MKTTLDVYIHTYIHTYLQYFLFCHSKTPIFFFYPSVPSTQTGSVYQVRMDPPCAEPDKTIEVMEDGWWKMGKHTTAAERYMFQTFFVEQRIMIVLELVVVYFFNPVVFCCNELSLIFVWRKYVPVQMCCLLFTAWCSIAELLGGGGCTTLLLFFKVMCSRPCHVRWSSRPL